LQVGDEVRLLAGQSLPADGVLIDGPAQVDEAVLTGESQPRTRHAGDAVVCGSFALSAALRMRVTAVGDATRFGQITALAQQAAASKPSLVRQADRYARLFVPLVLVLAALSALWWVRTDPARAVWSAVAVLIVTCPCALSLAAPAALLASAGALARRGVLLGNLQALEALAGVQRVVFDKTGTLTADRLRLVSVTPLRAGVQVDAALQRAAWLAAASLHPVSRAVVQAVQPTVNAFGEVAVREQPGQGLEATDAQGIHWRLGSDEFAGAEAAAASGPTAVLSDSQGPVVRLQFEEQLRADAVATVRALRDAGLQVSLLSGDQADAVQRVARACGIDTVLAAATPEAKVDYLKRCHALGERVLMVGDGLNDGPVLAAADVAIAVGEAVPLSKARADLVLPGSLLEPVAFAVTQARRTLRIVRQNLAWAVLYNLACVPLAMLGYLPPWLAGLGMAGSSLWVVSNALRLSRAPRTHATPPEPAADMARAAT
ncbi:MAG: cadmium-translocating P-type ATPase, partial [Betaproteobacteria bacterium]|nr:cadmium-translocating P-type ATPase [Betaproteobacteria bacterium]